MRQILIILTICLSGCFLTPLVDSFQKSGATPQARRALFPKKVNDFYREVVAARFLNFGEYLVSENQDFLLKKLREKRREEKVVGAKLDFVDFEDGATVVTADVIVEYYTLTHYTVKERIERQTWVFTGPVAGWQLKDLELVE